MADRAVGHRQPQGAGGEPQKRSIFNRRTFAQAALGTAAAAGAAYLTGWSAVRHAEHDDHKDTELTQHVVAKKIGAAIPRDPAAAEWKDVAAVEMPLMQQFMVAPRLQPDGLIPNATLKVMHNGSEIGFLVSWGDLGSNDLEVVGRFRDSVAVQLPVDPSGQIGVVMGQPGRPVHILHWRASWQRTVQKGPRTVKDMYPNAVNDFPPETLLKASPEVAKQWYPALLAGNSMAQRERKSPVEELVAEGYGTITSHAEQRADGSGVNTAGRWNVVLVMPMSGNQQQPVLKPGSSTRVAIAVWDGGKGDRGARKQFAGWVGLELPS